MGRPFFEKSNNYNNNEKPDNHQNNNEKPDNNNYNNEQPDNTNNNEKANNNEMIIMNICRALRLDMSPKLFTMANDRQQTVTTARYTQITDNRQRVLLDTHK